MGTADILLIYGEVVPDAAQQKVESGVILAAGDGDRLGDLARTLPKVLLPINRRELLIASPIRALAAVGIMNIAIVVGYLANEVRCNLGDGSQYKEERLFFKK